MPLEPCGCFMRDDRPFTHSPFCVENNERQLKRALLISEATKLRASGMSYAAIAQKLGLAESSVRHWVGVK